MSASINPRSPGEPDTPAGRTAQKTRTGRETRPTLRHPLLRTLLPPMNPFPFRTFSSALLGLTGGILTAAPQPLAPKAATASSALGNYSAANAIDGKVSDASRWVSQPSADPAWLAVDLGAVQQLAGVHLFTGFGATDAIADFKIQFWSGGKWTDIPSATIAGNKASARYQFSRL